MRTSRHTRGWVRGTARWILFASGLACRGANNGPADADLARPEVASDVLLLEESGRDVGEPCEGDPSSARTGVVASGPEVGAHARAAVGPGGRVCIVYARTDTGAVELACGDAVRAQGAWTVTSLAARIDPSWFGRSLDVVFTSDGTIVVFYRDADGQGLAAARVDADATAPEVVDATPLVGLDVSAVQGPDGDFHVAYLDLGHGDLRYAWGAPGRWEVEVADAGGVVGNDPSIALDRGGRVHVAYFGCGDLTLAGCSGELRYAVRKDGAFEPEIVEAGDDTGWYSSLILGDHDAPHLAWHVHGLGQLRYATRENGSWRVEVVDAGPGAGAFASLALVNGSPVLACHHREANGLRLAVRSPDGTWSRFLIPGAGAATWASLRALPGCKAFCAWRDEGSGALMGTFF